MPGSQISANPLAEKVTDRILSRLGLFRRPEPTLEDLATLYAAWCERVPFDNVRKMIHIRAGRPGPLPGDTAEDFFAGWLRHGTGGSCWAGAGAFHALLTSLGFEAERGVGTMLVRPDLPPNHGSVRVRLDEDCYLVDCSILHGEPLRLDENAETSVPHSAWGVRCAMREERWHVVWRPLHKLDGFECRLDYFGAPEQEFRERHDQTRAWSPFNYELTARVNRGDRVIGVSFGQIVSIEANGVGHQTASTHEERQRLLVEEIGLSEEIVSQLPPDTETPPPPKTTSRSE